MQRPRVPPLIALFIVLLFGAAAHGQLAAEISPANVLVSAQPGAQLTGAVTVRNPGSGSIDLTILRSDFALTPGGAIRPLPVGSLPTSLASWLSLSSSTIHLEPGQSQDLRYAVAVPRNAHDGTHWGTILFRTQTTGQSAGSGNAIGMGMVAQVAFVLYVNTGTLNRSGKVTAIAVTPKGSGKTSGPAIGISFQNTGNGYLKLSGRLELRSLQGKLVGTYTLPESPSLPGLVSTVNVPLSPAPASGTYLATAILSFGTPEQIAGQAQITLP